MRTVLLPLHLALLLSLLTACATSPEASSGSAGGPSKPQAVGTTRLSGNRVQLSFAHVPPDPALNTLEVEAARAVLAGFHQAFHQVPPLRVRRALASTEGPGVAAEWEVQLRREFLSRYGPPLFALPDSVESSRLYLALRLSPRYMAPGIRDAAREMFSSPVFLASVALSVAVYVAAWGLPEPVFSKAFAAALTVRLALAVGLLELRNLGLACLQLYREAEAARTVEQLEAVAERFGRAVGGAGLRVLMLAATFGVGRALPKVPEGGLWSLLGPPRYAVAEGMSWQTATAAQAVVADGTLVVSGVAVGTAASSASGGAGSACTDGAEKKDGYRWHHLATNKNETAEVRGGPWTPRFEDLFARAGMDLDAPENLVYLKGHQGPHPERYHATVYNRLEAALGECETVSRCRAYLVEELKKLSKDVCTPGSQLHELATRS